MVFRISDTFLLMGLPRISFLVFYLSMEKSLETSGVFKLFLFSKIMVMNRKFAEA